MLNNLTPNPAPPQLPLHELGVAIDALIALYDAAHGDSDLEDNGDELDGSICEDHPLFHDEHPMHGSGAGCQISDGDSEHDGREEERAQ